MDTKLKKFNLLTIRKIIAFILCLVCVAGCANQVIWGLFAYDDAGYYDHTFKDAFVYGGRKLGVSEVVKTRTFEHHMKNYIGNLSTMIGRFGNGTKEDYESWKKTVKENNEAAFPKMKQNLINHVIRDDFELYLELVRDGTVIPMGLIEASEYSGETYDYEEDTCFDELDYYYLCAQRVSAHELGNLPENVKKKADELKADGVFQIKENYNIVRYDVYYEDSEILESYKPGYYAFKIDDALLYDRLVKECILQLDDYGSAAEFSKAYSYYAEDNAEKYSTGRYFVKDSSGKVYTNVEGLTQKSTEEDIKQAFSELGFYCVYDKIGNFRLPDGEWYCYSEFASGIHSVYGNYDYEEYGYTYFETTTLLHTTTTVPVTTTLPSEISTTVVSTDENGNVQATQVQVSVPEPTTRLKLSKIDSTPFVDETDKDFIFYVGAEMFDEGYAENDRFRTSDAQIERAKGLIIDFFGVCGILGMLFLVCFIYLIAKAGRRKGSDEIHLLKTDRMFVEVRLLIDCVIGWLIFCCGIWTVDFFDDITDETRHIIAMLLTVIATAFAAVVLDLVLYLTKQLKAKTIHKNISVVWLVRKACAYYKGKIKPFMDEKFLYTKSFEKGTLIRAGIAVAANLVLGFVAFLELGFNETFFSWVLWFAFDVYVVIEVIRFIGGMHKIFSALEEIKNGNYDVHINKSALYVTLRETAEKVMSLRDGLKIAVDEAVKQEQTKTELITNVSHDLKTPLTSIINYVELLKKCEINDEDAKEYLGVLGEKSDRLKKLIEDLVEASKASTGNIKVDFVQVSLNEMINQLLGEHADGLEKKKLNVITDIPDGDLTVRADGKLLYRVMENLIVNVEKYSLYGTRVYVTVKNEGAFASVTFKNISEQPLNITADQLMERFVRGDESRSTEGNGLGLSIAQSLCNVQGGKLEISISGDLFTAVVKLKK